MMWKQWQNKAWERGDSRCMPIPFFSCEGRVVFHLSKIRNKHTSQEKTTLRLWPFTTERCGIICCSSAQRMDLQIVGQGDALGHQDTIEMVMAPLFCLKFQNEFTPYECFFSRHKFIHPRCSAQITNHNYGGNSRIRWCLSIFLHSYLTHQRGNTWSRS